MASPGLPPLVPSDGERVRVVVVGGGFAAAEALIALRRLGGRRVHLDLVSASPDLVLRPLAVTAPFGPDQRRRIPLADLCADHGATLHHGQVTHVDVARRIVETDRRESLPFDALLLATGARTRTTVRDAILFDGRRGIAELRALVEALEQGRAASVAFSVPDGVTWSLPAYELALQTAARAPGARVVLVTPEEAPLALFGRPASRQVAAVLAERGVEVLTDTTAHEVVPAGLLTTAGVVAVGHVVALPRIEGPRIPGVPADADGFVAVDGHGLVDGTTRVYAAGDVTDFPVKQGGLAAQQADAAARAIAARAGAPVEPEPFVPVLRALLLGGSLPLFLRGPSDAGAGAGPAPLWRPVGKVAARYLGPWLTDRRHAALGTEEPFVDHAPPRTVDRDEVRAGREVALMLADDEAAAGAPERALEWLAAVEALEGALPGEFAVKRGRWEAEAREGRRLARSPGEAW